MTPPVYPTTRADGPVDIYYGIEVADPYRWLEDDRSSERAAWIAAQNALVADYLSGVSVREDLRLRFEQLLQYPRYYDLALQGPNLFFTMNAGLQNQLVVHVQRGLTGTPRVLIDPTIVAPDGTTRVTSIALSKNTRYLAYGLSHRGSDWVECRVKDMESNQDLPEVLQWMKLSAIAWHGDGFYYSRYPGQPSETREPSARNEQHQVWYHRPGTPQSADVLVYEDPQHPLRLHHVQTTRDERFAVLTARDCSLERSGTTLWLLEEPGCGPSSAPIVTSAGDEYRLVGSREDCLLILTNRSAPNWRAVLIDPAQPRETNWRDVIPEGPHRLEGLRVADGHLFATYQVDGAHRICVFRQTGRFLHEIPLPGLGMVRVFEGQPEDTDVLWSFSSFTKPTTIYRYRVRTGTSTVFWQPQVRFSPDDYETQRVFYRSRDGTRIPMFVVHHKRLSLDGTHPLLLYGYGGSGASMNPAFDPLLIPLLERGVVFALPCLRGGGEYGEAWHHAGWRDRKQNVFDDCIAAAEWLQTNGYTSRDRCALTGSSNGGLLVGAVMTQRPDLFKVALPDVGVMDMLRFQKFTVGSTWAAEYGTSDDPVMLPVLLAYSPLHNIKAGVRYPATLVTTSEHDDRVVPAHSFKFIATLQSKGVGAGPYLIRIETKSGHGPVSLPKMLDERADVYAFLLMHVSNDHREPEMKHHTV